MVLTFSPSGFLVCTSVVYVAHVKICKRGWGQYSPICKEQKMLCTEQWETDLWKNSKQSELDYCNAK